jgi:glutamate-5-semialdehyde dehydrogenase
MFMERVEGNVVCMNAATRLTDGVQFGFGGEMGISTQILPCGGPIGPLQLLRRKFFLYGDGHLR